MRQDPGRDVEADVEGGTAGTRTASAESVGPGKWWRRVLGLTLAAILLRLLLFLGRGDYLAFDEGWYLLLGRSLFSGDGYSLVGVPHVTLSPLFPVLAGGTGWFLESWVWGGRVVAAVSSGLLIIPAWAVFRRLTAERTAFTALIIVTVLPTLAPFGVPFFIGADLWVGAEPLLHLFLYSGVALWLKAREGEGWVPWLLTGGAFGLAFLARPEAIITWGFLGLGALGLAAFRRSPKILSGAFLMGLGFVLVASPYWIHIHGATGRWSLTGRGISATSNALRMVSAGGRGGPSATIEGMLWGDDDRYVERLYGLDETGLRLRSDYWGVFPNEESPEPVGESAPEADPGQDMAPSPAPPPSFPRVFLLAMTTLFPAPLWPLALLGLLGPRGGRDPTAEAPVLFSLVGTSLSIALLVAVDPRTQLFLAPILALYLARGIHFLDQLLSPSLQRLLPRPGFLRNLLLGVIVLWLLGTSVTRLYLATTFGSPHHLVAAQNRMVAQELDTFFQAPPGPLASFHPALALWAERDWRVLPNSDLPGIIRYSQASGAKVLVLSAYYPPFRGEAILGTRYLVLPVPEGPPAPKGASWVVTPVRGDTLRGLGALEAGSGSR